MTSFLQIILVCVYVSLQMHVFLGDLPAVLACPLGATVSIPPPYPGVGANQSGGDFLLARVKISGSGPSLLLILKLLQFLAHPGIDTSLLVPGCTPQKCPFSVDIVH